MKKSNILGCLMVGAALLTTPTLATAASGTFVSKQSANEWLGSKLIGVNVYDTQKNKIGDISQLLVDRDGRIQAVVIGVGGFLGIDKKDVAVPFSSLRWVAQESADTGKRSTTGAADSSKTDAAKGYPDHAILGMTKDQLKAAPDFHYASDTKSDK